MFQLADEIWVEECWIRFLGFQLQTSMAVLRLGGRKLLLYSPRGCYDEGDDCPGRR